MIHRIHIIISVKSVYKLNIIEEAIGCILNSFVYRQNIKVLQDQISLYHIKRRL